MTFYFLGKEFRNMAFYPELGPNEGCVAPKAITLLHDIHTPYDPERLGVRKNLFRSVHNLLAGAPYPDSNAWRSERIEDLQRILLGLHWAFSPQLLADINLMLGQHQGRLEALEIAEVALAETLAKEGNPLFPYQVAADKIWRLLIDGRDHERGKFCFESEAGYLAGLTAAFNRSLQTPHEPMTAELYRELHDLAVQNVWRRWQSVGFDAGFGEGKVGFDIILPAEGSQLDSATTGTREGIDRIKGSPFFRQFVEDGEEFNAEPEGKWFALGKERLEEGRIKVLFGLYRTNALNSQRRVEFLLSRFYEKMQEIQGAEGRFRKIIELGQDLDQSHVFPDGNIRTVVFLVVNRLLLQDGQIPLIMANPNVFDGFDLDLLVQTARRGQQRFLEHFPRIVQVANPPDGQGP